MVTSGAVRPPAARCKCFWLTFGRTGKSSKPRKETSKPTLRSASHSRWSSRPSTPPDPWGAAVRMPAIAPLRPSQSCSRGWSNASPCLLAAALLALASLASRASEAKDLWKRSELSPTPDVPPYVLSALSEAMSASSPSSIAARVSRVEPCRHGADDGLLSDSPRMSNWPCGADNRDRSSRYVPSIGIIAGSITWRAAEKIIHVSGVKQLHGHSIMCL